MTTQYVGGYPRLYGVRSSRTDFSISQLKEIESNKPAKHVGLSLGIDEKAISAARKKMKSGTFSLPYFSNLEKQWLCETHSYLTIDQQFDFLKRSRPDIKKQWVQTTVSSLVKRGLAENAKGRNINPFRIPQNSVLLAKTCSDCGFLLGAFMFQKLSSGIWLSCCKVCQIDRKSNRRPENSSRQNENNRLKALNDTTLEFANRNGYEWTSEEIENLKKYRKEGYSVLEAALFLGRSYSGVVQAISRFNLSSPQKEKMKREDGKWIILFPKAIEVLKENFKSLGVPESEWAWND